jgi:hypothetical protein
MLTNEFIEEFTKLRDDEDASLWQQGDMLKEAAFARSELKKVAELAQKKASTLAFRERVSRETPPEKRDKKYSWSIYSIFVQIEDHDTRWSLMFSRPAWTVEAANKAVKETQKGDITQPPKSITGKMYVGDILVSGRMEKGDRLSLKVWVPDSYDVDVDDSNRRYTIVTFNP